MKRQRLPQTAENSISSWLRLRSCVEETPKKRKPRRVGLSSLDGPLIAPPWRFPVPGDISCLCTRAKAQERQPTEKLLRRACGLRESSMRSIDERTKISVSMLLSPHVHTPGVPEAHLARRSRRKAAPSTLCEFSKNEVHDKEGLPRHRGPSAEGLSR